MDIYIGGIFAWLLAELARTVVFDAQTNVFKSLLRAVLWPLYALAGLLVLFAAVIF